MKKLIFILVAWLVHTSAHAQWTSIPSGTTETLRSVHFPSATTGYAVGHNSTLLKSTNGGNSWTALTSPVAGHWFWDVHFTSVDTGFVVGEANPNTNPSGAGIILKTTNGGASWTTLYNNPFTPIRDLFVVNKDTLYACGGAEWTNSVIIRSVNGGATWASLGAIFYDAMLGGMVFKDGNTGFLGIYETVGGNFNPTHSSWGTIAGGNTLTTQVSSPFNYWNFASDMVGNTGYMMRSTYNAPALLDTIYIRKTVNGGTSWVETGITTVLNSAYGLDFVNADTGYVVGETGMILRTTNGGASWATQVSGTTNRLYDVFFVNSATGFAVGENGQILKFNSCPATYHTITQTACNSYTLNGQTYTSSGQYTQTLLNSQGCDSVLTLNLTISAPSVTVNLTGGMLNAVTSATSFQWLKCNPFSIVPGANSQSYTPTSNGDYAVEVTQNGCKDTSTCINVKGVGLNDYEAPTEFDIYPNPTTDKLVIQSNHSFTSLKVNIYSTSGQLLFHEETKQFAQKEVDLTNYASGVYFVELIDDQNQKFRIKVLKSE